jgi:hypothetical protein
MDPDMVRQQEEAERESLLLKAPKQAPLPPLKSEAAAAIVDDLRSNIAAPAAARKPSGAILFLAGLGRFVQAAVAGAILGGGAGILAVNMLGLASDEAQIPIFGPALAVALVCGVISASKAR